MTVTSMTVTPMTDNNNTITVLPMTGTTINTDKCLKLQQATSKTEETTKWRRTTRNTMTATTILITTLKTVKTI